MKIKVPIANRFAALSFLCVVALAIVMGFALSSLLMRAVSEWESHHAATLLKREVELAGLDALFAAPPRRETFDRWWREFAGRLAEAPEIVHVNIWDAGATILWSNEAKLIGQRFGDDQELRAALTGNVVALVKEPSKADEAYSYLEGHGMVVDVYVPIVSRTSGQILGVLEFYKLPSRLAATLRWGLVVIWTIALVGGVVLSLVLLPLFKQVYGRQVREETLREHVGGLEQEVAQGTRDLQVEMDRTAGLLVETRARLRETETLLEVGRLLSLDLPTQEAMRLVAREIARAFGADMVGAYFLDARKEALVPMAGYRVPKALLQTFLGTPFPLSRFAFIREACGTLGPVWTADAMSDPRFDNGVLDAVRPRAVVFAPTPVRGEVVGGLFLVWWTPGRTFAPAEIRLVEGVASQVGLALENADLARQTWDKLRETETLLSVSRVLSSTLDLHQLLRHFLRQVARTIEADSVGAWLLDSTTGLFRPEAGYRVPPHLLEPLRRYRIDPREGGFYAEGVAQKHVLVSANVADDPRIPASLKAVAPHRSQLFVPIVVKERVIGAFIAIWLERSHEFSDRELALVQAMGSQAGVAIENVRLFQEHRRKLEEMSVLHELSLAVVGQWDTAHLVEAIHQQVGRVLDARNMVIHLYDEGRAEFQVALRMLDGKPDPNPTRRYPHGHGLVSRVVERRRAIRTSSYVETCRQEGVEPIAATLPFPNLLGVPMIAGGQALGVLALRSALTPFTDSDERLLSDIAGLAALAIRSARLFEEKTRAYADLAAAQEQLVRTENLRSLGEIAGGVAHDFNNILAAILGRVQLMLLRTADPKVQQQLRVVEQAVQDGARTVRRLQEFAGMRRSRPPQRVDLNQVVEEAVEITRSRWKDQAQVRGIRYDVRFEPVPVPPVAGDPSELCEALTNLLLNALDAMPDGGRVTIRTEVGGDRVSCAVNDTGVGMTEEVRRRVFDPFFTTKGERGSGLGLSVVYGIVTRHGGEIEVRSQVGQGSQFTIRLPVGREFTEAPPRAPAAPHRGAAILVIDDEPAVRDVLAELLAGLGHAVTACADGRSGLARVDEGPVDLVITDLGMPGVSGWEVARLVKERRPGIPVALVTGWGDGIDDAEAREKGVDFLLSKPFKIEHLADIVTRALSRAAPAGG